MRLSNWRWRALEVLLCKLSPFSASHETNNISNIHLLSVASRSLPQAAQMSSSLLGPSTSWSTSNGVHSSKCTVSLLLLLSVSPKACLCGAHPYDLSLGLITLILLLVMVTSVFFGFRQRGEVLVLPVATLFAFTQLRGSMPGAPEGFGMCSLSDIYNEMMIVFSLR
jgi:hypothetical protein